MAKTLAEKINLLAQAVALLEQRSDVTEANEIINRAKGRLWLSTDNTVVALAGATGSGKSSLFNALTGADLANVSVLRPTTSSTMAASSGKEATELLDWLDIRLRNEVRWADPKFESLVLLDLPDHDSTEAAHRAEVDRLVEAVDQFVFVVDPQKYADSALHNEYLRKMVGYDDVMLVVLNKVDLLSPQDLENCVTDLRDILNDDGLGKVKILQTSTKTGAGIAELKAELAAVAERKNAANARLDSDIKRVAGQLATQLGEKSVGEIAPEQVAKLIDALATAASVETVVDAVDDAVYHRGMLVTGWPFLAWLRKFKPDPIRRLRLGEHRQDQINPVELVRTALPKPSVVGNAKISTAVRDVATAASEGLPYSWRDSVMAAGRIDLAIVADDLDRAIATTPLNLDSGSGWRRFIQLLQWLLVVAVVIGGGWLLANILLAYLMLPQLPVLWLKTETGFQLALPTVLLIGGVVGGILFSALSRFLVRISASRAGEKARKELHKSIATVADQVIISPIKAELDRHDEAVSALAELV